MENFFYDGRFCGDLSDIMGIFDIDSENIDQLEEDWSCKVEETTLEPIFNTNAKELCELLSNHNEERFSEEFDSNDEQKLIRAISLSVDFEKLKTLLPQYYYPSNNFVIITKKDLIEYCS